MRRLAASYLLVAHLIVGCAALVPQSFDERIAAGYAAVAITNDTATTLVIGGTISKDDGRAVLEQTRTAREAIDVASTLNGQLGDDKLTSALGILRAAQDALCARYETDPNCVALRARSQP